MRFTSGRLAGTRAARHVLLAAGSAALAARREGAWSSKEQDQRRHASRWEVFCHNVLRLQKSRSPHSQFCLRLHTDGKPPAGARQRRDGKAGQGLSGRSVIKAAL